MRKMSDKPEQNQIMEFIFGIVNRSDEEVNKSLDKCEQEIFKLLEKGIDPNNLISLSENKKVV